MASIQDFFEPLGQYGVRIKGGMEMVAERAAIGYQRANAFNSVKRSPMRPALDRNAPTVARFVYNLCARTPPKLLFRREGVHVQLAHSPLTSTKREPRPSLTSATGVKLFNEFRRYQSGPGARNTIICMYGVVIFIPLEMAHCVRAVADVAQWPQHHLHTEKWLWTVKSRNSWYQKTSTPSRCRGNSRESYQRQDDGSTQGNASCEGTSGYNGSTRALCQRPYGGGTRGTGA